MIDVPAATAGVVELNQRGHRERCAAAAETCEAPVSVGDLDGIGASRQEGYGKRQLRLPLPAMVLEKVEGVDPFTVTAAVVPWIGNPNQTP